MGPPGAQSRLGKVRLLCLVMAALYAALLLWTCHAAAQRTDGVLLEIASIAGALPALIVAYLNMAASRSMTMARAVRRRFEREFMQGALE